MRSVADTSFIIAALHAEDPHHREAVGILEEGGPPAICREALAESLQVARFKTRQQEGPAAAVAAQRRALGAILDGLGAILEDRRLDLEQARNLFEGNPRLSWADAVILVHARGRNLWTFDRDQQALHGKPR